MAQIILNIDAGDRVKEFNKDELLQIEAYESANKQLSHYAALSEQTNKEQQNANWSDDPTQPLERIHNAIFIDGERGTGKTAFMLNLKQMYQEHNGQTDGLYFSQPIDPTLLDVKEDFLNIIIGQIHAEVERHTSSQLDDYYQQLNKIAEALESESTSKHHVGIDKILSFKSSLGLERNLFDYFTAATKALKANAIVLLIDDVDMSLDMAFNVLEVIRKYLACPFIIPIVSGDKKQYNALMYKHFVEKLAIDGKKPNEEEQASARDLAHKYIQKLFPEHGQIRLKTFPELLSNPNIKIRINKDVKEEEAIHYSSFLRRIEQVIMAGVQNCDHEWDVVAPQTCRAAIQLHSKLKDVQSNNQSEDILALLFDQDGSTITQLYQNTKLLSELASYFQATNKTLLSAAINTTIELINQRHAPYWIPIRNIGIFNLYNSPKSAHAERKGYYIENTINQLGDFPFMTSDKVAQEKYLQNLPEISISYPRVELFSSNLKYSKSRLKNNDFQSDDTKLLLSLYTHANYFNFEQIGYLFFFGKMADLLITSLIKPLNSEEINALLSKAPWHSFFQFFPNRFAAEEGDGSDNETPYLAGDVDYSNLALEIARWHDSHALTAHFNAIQLRNIFFKYLENCQLLSSKSFIMTESLHHIHTRVKYIFLNACASYDAELFNEDSNQQQLSRQNIAANEYKLETEGDNDIASSIETSLAYRKNIALYLNNEKPSLTKAFNQHPIFNIICQNDKPTSFSKKSANKTFNLIVSDNLTIKDKSPIKFFKIDTELAEKVKHANESPSHAAKMALRLYGLTTVEERESISQMYHHRIPINGKLIYNLCIEITLRKETTPYKKWFKEYTTKNRSLFGKLYAVAKRADTAEILDNWFNSKD